MERKIRVGYVSPVDPFKDRKAWSGTYYSTREALSNMGYDIRWVSYRSNNLFTKLFRRVYQLIFGRDSSFTHSRLSSWSKVRTLAKLDDCDVIFIPGQVDIVAGIKTAVPVVYYTDGTVPLMIDYYWFNFTKRSTREAKLVEKRALNKATVNIFASDWARNSAVNDYGISNSKCKVLPFGANLTISDLANVKSKSTKSRYDQFNLFFSGVDWVRKGGQIAVDAAQKMINDGYKVKLTIVGIKNLDTKISRLDFVDNLGFFDKRDKSQYQKYLDAWQNADILILPTRAECAGIVFNEASAFGVPIITTDTGGIPNYVMNGLNGERLPLKANGQAYASVIEEWINDDRLPTLSNGARKVYDESNSWLAWGRNVDKIINELVCK